MTQLELAGSLGVDRSLIRYYERDAEDAKLEFARRCAQALGIPVEQLLSSAAVRQSPEARQLDRLVRQIRKLGRRDQKMVVQMFSRQISDLVRERRLKEK